MRVWPGSGGLELFRLQLRGLLDKHADDRDIAFVIEASGAEPICLPGLESYGVATYCAAIAAALSGVEETAAAAEALDLKAAPATHRGPARHESHSRDPSPAPDTDDDNTPASYDDWLDLLCSVADMLEAEGHRSNHHCHRDSHRQMQRTLAPVPSSSWLTVWFCVGSAARGAASEACCPLLSSGPSERVPYNAQGADHTGSHTCGTMGFSAHTVAMQALCPILADKNAGVVESEAVRSPGLSGSSVDIGVGTRASSPESSIQCEASRPCTSYNGAGAGDNLSAQAPTDSVQASGTPDAAGKDLANTDRRGGPHAPGPRKFQQPPAVDSLVRLTSSDGGDRAGGRVSALDRTCCGLLHLRAVVRYR